MTSETVTLDIVARLANRSSRRNLVTARIATLLQGSNFETATISVNNTLQVIGPILSFCMLTTSKPIDVIVTRGLDTVRMHVEDAWLIFGAIDNLAVQAQELGVVSEVTYYRDHNTTDPVPPALSAQVGLSFKLRNGTPLQVPVAFY